MDWNGKPYYSLDAYCKRTFGEKIYKIALDAGLSCPNRDGTLGTQGCLFCSEGGSGEFAARASSTISGDTPVKAQLKAGKELFEGRIVTDGKLKPKKTGQAYIAYFQAYTNTYAPIPHLEELYRAALAEPYITGISIATRPDCVDHSVCNLLCTLKEEFPAKLIWIELGLQTMYEKTARLIRRGYPLSCFENCLSLLVKNRIPVIVHIILGLPGESREMMLDTIRYLNRYPIFGIKLQLLHVLKDTGLHKLYLEQKYTALTMDEYIEILISCLEILSPEFTVHRLTGDGPRKLLAAPLWSLDKRKVLNTLHLEMKKRNTWQGKYFTPDISKKRF